jgi:hypothetical protein
MQMDVVCPVKVYVLGEMVEAIYQHEM